MSDPVGEVISSITPEWMREPIAETLGKVENWIKESPLFGKLASIFGMGGDSNGSRETGSGPVFSRQETPLSTPQQQPSISQERAIPIERSMDASMLATLKGLGDTIKTGKAPEGVLKTEGISFGYDPSVLEASAPLSTPKNIGMGTRSQGASMAM